jgi:hypothetical protein
MFIPPDPRQDGVDAADPSSDDALARILDDRLNHALGQHDFVAFCEAWAVWLDLIGGSGD